MHTEDMTITELHEALRSGKITPLDIHTDARRHIDAHNEELNAFVELFDDALAQMKEDTHQALFAVSCALKDNLLMEGKISSAGSKILEHYRAPYDATVTRLLKDQGVMILGRTNMDEFAMGSSTESSYYGPTKNPLDTHRVPGGSSGGSAAAVAAKMVHVALGSDTGGSIRQPAAYCGVVGLKPSYGAISRNGLMALSSSLDVIGPITRSVADAKLVFDALAVHDPLDSTSVPEDLRRHYQEKGNTNTKVIGIPRSFIETEGLDPLVKEHFEKGLRALEAKGYTLRDIDLPLLGHSLAVYYILQPAEASSNLARYDGIRFGMRKEGEKLLDSYIETRSDGFGDEVKRRIMLGTHVLSSGYHDEYYYKAVALREAISREIHEALKDVDVIATPTTASIAFPLGGKKDPVAMYLEDIFTVPYNLSGNPAIALPFGKSKEGLPYSMQFVAPLFCEEKLFEIASDFESAVIQ